MIHVKPQMIIWLMPIVCGIPKATNRHSEYVILIALSLQQLLHERASMLRYTYIACLVFSVGQFVLILVETSNTRGSFVTLILKI
jgi:hypothetical protein